MSHNHRKYIWLIPGKILDRLQNIDKNYTPFHGFNIDYLYQTVSTISVNLREDSDGVFYARISSVVLRKVVPNGGRYIKYLQQIGVIVRNKRYKPREHSYGFKFAPKYESKFVIIPVTNHRLILRIKNANTYLRNRNSKKYPSQNRDLSRMTIDYEEAKKFIDQHYPNVEVNKYNYALSCIIRIHRGDIYIKVNQTNNRLDSNFTNMPKILRQFVRIEGKPLWGVDISNSQPYMLALVMLYPERLNKFFPGRFPLKAIQAFDCANIESVKKYISLVGNGDLYGYLQEEFLKRGRHVDDYEDFKKKVLIILFDQNYHISANRKIFSELFPEVSEVCKILRTVAHRNLPIMLQRMEAFFVLDVILKQLNSEYSDMVTITVHDSIYTNNRSDQLIVYAKMEKELHNLTGIKPTLKASNPKGERIYLTENK